MLNDSQIEIRDFRIQGRLASGENVKATAPGSFHPPGTGYFLYFGIFYLTLVLAAVFLFFCLPLKTKQNFNMEPII